MRARRTDITLDPDWWRFVPEEYRGSKHVIAYGLADRSAACATEGASHATCDEVTPEGCSKCGIDRGETLAHLWPRSPGCDHYDPAWRCSCPCHDATLMLTGNARLWPVRDEWDDRHGGHATWCAASVEKGTPGQYRDTVGYHGPKGTVWWCPHDDHADDRPDVAVPLSLF